MWIDCDLLLNICGWIVMVINQIHVYACLQHQQLGRLQQLVQMGNKDSLLPQSSLQPIQNLDIPHLGHTTLIKNNQAFCLLKVYSFSDLYLMEERLRKFKTRVHRLADNAHVLNIYSVNKVQKKQVCANNYQLLVYMERHECSLSEMVDRRLKDRNNFHEKELFQFLMKVVESLIYIQDNGLKNIQLDAEAIILSNNCIKILDCGIACSKTYYKLLEERQKGFLNDHHRIYLAPELLKDLKQLNYDPYISPKADIFSLGMLLFEMVTLQPMHGYYDYLQPSLDYESLIHRLSRINHSLNLKTLLAEMLQYDPDERIGLISLREKIQKLNNHSMQSMPRSKSSTMLKQFLSQSRNSNFSSKNESASSAKRQSTQSRNKMQPHLTGSSNTTSRQLFSQANKDNQRGLEKTSLPSKVGLEKKSLPSKESAQQMPKESIINLPFVENFHFKNLVKNKLNKNKQKENLSEKDEQSLSSKAKCTNQQFGKSGNNLSSLILKQKNINQLQASFKRRGFEAYGQLKGQYRCNQNGFKKIVEDSKINNISKVERLDCDSKKSPLQESLEHTSRFGNAQTNETQTNQDQSVITSQRRKVSQVYVQEQNELQLQQLRFQGQERQLKKAMTFNKQFLKIAGGLQSLTITDHQQKYGKFRKKQLQFKIEKEEVIEIRRGELQESPCSRLRIKDVVIVISQEKEIEGCGQMVEYRLGTLQKQLNMMDYVESIDQDNSCDSHLNGSSKVISTYPSPHLEAEYFNITNNQHHFNHHQDNSCFIKKASLKPYLKILVNDQQNYYSGEPHKVLAKEDSSKSLIQRAITLKENNTYKPMDAHNISHFATISPIQQQDQSHSQYDYTRRIPQYSNINNFPQQSNRKNSPQQRAMRNESTYNLFNKMKLSSGQMYEGQLSKEGVPNGNGILELQNKYKYSGSLRNGRFHGFGTLINLQPSNEPLDFKQIDLNKHYWLKFQGQFQNGTKNGFGTIFFNGGQKFSGCLKGDVIEGYGCFYRGGQLISGLWCGNSFNKI